MKQRNILVCGAVFGMLVLIFDGQTAIAGMGDGIEICLKTLIPSLFPFFVLSGVITSSLAGQPIPILAPFNKICYLPPGSESFFAVGILGGYPVGAANLANPHRRGYLSAETATRLAVFCNNAGPGFIFGVLSGTFPHISWALSLWFVQVLGALLTGHLLGGHPIVPNAQTQTQCNATSLLNNAMRSMAGVCGWVVLFRMCLTFLDKWILQFLPVSAQVLLTGLLELSNGCLGLGKISDPAVRFLIATALLSLGGLCVLMQTKAVFPELELEKYLRGKLIHLYCSALIALAAVSILEHRHTGICCGIAAVGLIAPIYLRNARNSKKEVAIP